MFCQCDKLCCYLLLCNAYQCSVGVITFIDTCYCVMLINVLSVWSPQQTEGEWTRSDFDENSTNWHTKGDHHWQTQEGHYIVVNLLWHINSKVASRAAVSQLKKHFFWCHLAHWQWPNTVTTYYSLLPQRDSWEIDKLPSKIDLS